VGEQGSDLSLFRLRSSDMRGRDDSKVGRVGLSARNGVGSPPERRKVVEPQSSYGFLPATHQLSCSMPAPTMTSSSTVRMSSVLKIAKL